MTPPAVAGAAAPRAELETVRAFFFISAPADPGLLPRLIEPVDGRELTVDLRLAGIAPRTADLVERALRAVVGVRQVVAIVEPEGGP